MPDYGSFEYGGVKFTRLVPQAEIASYTASLSEDKKGDIQQIVMSLESAGLLAIEEVPQQVTPQQEKEIGFARRADPTDVVSKEYGAIELMSPSLSAQAGQIAGQGQEVRAEAQKLSASTHQSPPLSAATREAAPRLATEAPPPYAASGLGASAYLAGPASPTSGGPQPPLPPYAASLAAIPDIMYAPTGPGSYSGTPHASYSAGPDHEVSQYTGQAASSPRPGSISSSLKVNTGYLHNP